MKRFSLRAMRMEAMPVLRLPLLIFVADMLFASFFGALLAARHAVSSSFPLALGIPGVISLLCLGSYLMLSDEKRLLRTTVFGKCLVAMGDPQAIMKEIDEEALEKCDGYSRFVLLKTWLILLEPEGAGAPPFSKAVHFRPIPRASIQLIIDEPFSASGDSCLKRLTIQCRQGVYSLPCFDQRDLDALRSWIKEQE